MKIWEILRGAWNSLFKTDKIEKLAAQRMEICKNCSNYDTTGEGCAVPGTQPCCNKLTGGCGCKLYLKVRSNSSCPIGKWSAQE